MKGDTGLNLIQLLETRFDNLIYRAGFAKTRPHARQMVNHSFFFVNGKRVTIPSFKVSVKDVVTIKPTKDAAKVFETLDEQLKKVVAPSWFTVNAAERKVTITGSPKAEEAEQTFNPRTIVEFYSK
jgi:small subunit ribosomal protein S4